MDSSSKRRQSNRPLRRFVTIVAACAVVGSTTSTRADERAPASRKPRSRSCCAFASKLPIHLGSAHMPISLRIVTSAKSLGHHSYTGWDRLGEGDGLVYTERGGFIDLGHTRDYADMTAYLTVRLRPLLARGSGVVTLEPLGSGRSVVVTNPVPTARLDVTSAEIAQRAAFEISVWAEIVQYYGRGKIRGAEEVYSAFTPEDLFSNLLGTHLGRRGVLNARPYDDVIDTELTATLERLGAVSTAEGQRTMARLAGRWWSPDVAWPSAAIAIARSFDIGPRVHPRLVPHDASHSLTEAPEESPATLDVPETDPAGVLLSDYYHVELRPNPEELPRFPFSKANALVTGDDLPRLVQGVRASIEAKVHEGVALGAGGEQALQSPLTHYLNGLRLLELGAVGGIVADVPEGGADGVLGGSLAALVGDTRGGDFGFARFDVQHTSERGLIAGFSLFHSDAAYFCRDPDVGAYRPPFVSLLGPCARGEWIGIGGSLGEGVHDGGTGRTALRPISAYAVVNPLGNGQSPSYERIRVLVRGGGAVEHMWTEVEGGVTIPRVGGGVVLLARAMGSRLEARGTVDCSVDPAAPQDTAFQSSAALRWNFLLGGKATEGPVDGVDPWGVASIGLAGGYSYWGRPLHAFPDITTPFVSDEHTGTWQLLLTGTLGFEGLSF